MIVLGPKYQMRAYIDILNEGSEGWRPIKAWYNPTSEKVIEMSFFDKHSEVVDKRWKFMGLPRGNNMPNITAVEHGWVRISSATEVSDAPHGYVTARSVDDAQKAVKWILSINIVPQSIDIEIYQKDRCVDFFTLDGEEIDRFAKRGVKSRVNESAESEFDPAEHYDLVERPGDIAPELIAIEKRAREKLMPALQIRQMTLFYVAPGEFDGAFGVYVGGTFNHAMIGLDLAKHRQACPDRNSMLLEIEATLAHELAHACQDRKHHINGDVADEDGADEFAVKWVTRGIIDTSRL